MVRVREGRNDTAEWRWVMWLRRAFVVSAMLVLLPAGPWTGRASAQSPTGATPSAGAPSAGAASAWVAAPVDRVLPGVRPFRAPAADPLAARLSVSAMSTDLLATRGPERPPWTLQDPGSAEREFVAAVALGGILPLLRLAEWPDGVAVLVLDARVFGRFRVEKGTRDDMGQDWFIGGGVEAARSRWSGRALFMHRSSHLGDEFMVETGAQRIEFGSEHLDLLGAYEVPGLARLYGGGSLILRSYVEVDPWLRELDLSDRAMVQLGADREWLPWQDERFGVVAGVDWQAAERTSWRRSLSALLGVGVQGLESGRVLQLVLRFFDGPSTMGEFFLTPERAYSMELRATF
jgi:hypothetical protein